MPYNVNRPRQRSRRHLAALTFLSNISLDGTHRDTNLGRYYNIGVQGSCYAKDSFDKENHVITEISPHNEDVKSISTDHRPSKESFTRSGQNQLYNSSQVLLNSSSKGKFSESDNSFECGTLSKKNNFHQIPLIKKLILFNSNENIVTSSTSTGTSGRGRKLSLTLSEASVPSTKDVKSLQVEGYPVYRDGKLVFLSRNKFACHIFSCLSFNRASHQEIIQKDGVRRCHTSGTGTHPISTISDSNDPAHIIGLSCFEDTAEISFSDLLVPSKNFSYKPKSQQMETVVNVENSEKMVRHPSVSRCFSFEPTTFKTTSHYINTGNAFHEGKLSVGKDKFIYVPNMLDDPELRAGKHRKMLRFSSYMTSITDYTKPFELKKELNDKFREKFPHIQLTLSKLRSLKRELLKIVLQECEIGILTVAQAYVYFEKMILMMYLNKQNRKLIAGACLILSAKMNDVKGEVLSNLIDKTETSLRLSRRELLSWEFACLVALEFALHVPSWEVNPHFQRLHTES